jgi:CRISPR-associated endonuclease Cas2
MIFYDVSDDGLRTKLHNKLEALGFVRLQYSVFCGRHTDGQWLYCKYQLDELVRDKLECNDKINILCIKPDELRKMVYLGSPSEIEEILNPPLVLWI